MDLQHLQLLAGRARDLLQQSRHPVSHNQSLDLIAALPGLRNWPEVRAFPARVAACQLDQSAAGRLAFRLERKFGIKLSPPEILDALAGKELETQEATAIWPFGPPSGVYVTTSPAAIAAAVARYEEASDGAILYAERAANGAHGAIDLGEYGLWSSGLDRVPSGTLIVVGPLVLVQQEWRQSIERLQMACTHAELSGHRVLVLAETPRPQELHQDIRLMANAVKPEEETYESALRGTITEDGDLVPIVPFAAAWPRVEILPSIATADAIPEEARRCLEEELRHRKTGFLVFGGDAVRGHWAADLIDAGLALTDHMGPAARIMPRNRSSPEKNWLVPEGMKQLPYLPSIQSAYARGYRRMVIDPHHLDGDELRSFGDEVLFLAGTHGFEARTILFGGVRCLDGTANDAKTLEQIIGLVGVVRVPSKHAVCAISDLFLGSRRIPAGHSIDIDDLVARNRAIRWEDQAQRMLESGEITIADLKTADPQSTSLRQFVRQAAEQIGGTKQ